MMQNFLQISSHNLDNMELFFYSILFVNQGVFHNKHPWGVYFHSLYKIYFSIYAHKSGWIHFLLAV